MSEKTDQQAVSSSAPSAQRLRLTLRQLEVFVATARAGSTRGGALRVARSQSAASAALAELEAAFGQPLFDRIGRRLQLNDAGRTVLPGALAVLEQAMELQSLLGSGVAPPLRVAASLTIGEYLLPDHIARWHLAHTGSLVQMTVGNTAKVIRAVVEREVDLGFVEGPQTHPDLLLRRWLEDELVIVAAPSHPLAQRAPTLRALAAAEWILREPDSGTRQAADAWLLPRLGALRVAFELGSTEAIKRLAAAGAGLACMSRHTVAAELHGGTLVALSTPLPRARRPLAVVMRRDRPPRQTATAFLQHCLRKAKADDPDDPA